MEQTTYKKLLASFTVMYMTILGTLLIFAMVVLYLNRSFESAMPDDDPFKITLRYVLVGLLPAGIGAGYYVYKLMIGRVAPELTLREKYIRYQGAALVRAALCEIPGMMGCVVAFITHDNSFLLFTAISAVMLLLWRPTTPTIAEDLRLSAEEKATLDDPDAIFK